MKVGNSLVVGLKIGTTPVRAAYVGSTKIWPTEQPYTYTLENLVLHYSDDGSYLKANGNNYAWLTADYKTWQGATLISTQNVTCLPVYQQSLSSPEPIKTNGHFLYWDRDNYGTTVKNADYIYVSGSYNNVTTSTQKTVNTESNFASATYSYRKSFTISSLSGNVPAVGGQYSFTAVSYRTEHLTWTSGKTSSSESAFSSNLSCSPSVTFSHSLITGTVNGKVTFPENTDSFNPVSYRFDLYSSTGGGHTYTTYTQSKSDRPVFSIEPTSWSAPQTRHSLTVNVTTNYPSFSVVSNDFWLRADRSSGNTVILTADDNYQGERRGSVTFTPEGGTSVILNVTQAGFVPQLELNTQSISDVPAVGNFYDVLVTHNLPSITIEASHSWLTYSGSLSSKPTTIRVTVGSNDSPARTGYLYFKYNGTTLATLTVNQKGRSSYLVLTPGESPQTLASGSMVFSVEASSSWTCEVTFSSSGWTVTPDYNANTITVSRTPSALVRGISFKVTSGIWEKTMAVSGALSQ